MTVLREDLEESQAVDSSATMARPDRSSPRHASSGYLAPSSDAVKSYEDLDGALGREVFFRPHRYCAADLAPLTVDLRVTSRGKVCRCRMRDVSQSGIAFEWPQTLGDDIAVDELSVSFDRYEAYRGPVRVIAVRETHGVRLVGVQFVSFLINMDDVAQLRELGQWLADDTAVVGVARKPWNVAGHLEFKSKVAEFRLFLDEAKSLYEGLERLQPWTATLGEAPAPARQALIERVEREFVPDVLRYSQEIWDSLVGVPTAELPALQAFTRRQLHGHFLDAQWLERAHRKPFGYPGDYEVMRSIYGKCFEGRSLFGRAMNYAAVLMPAACSVRARKDAVKQALVELIERHAATNTPVRILSVAAGPAQEVFELLSEAKEIPVPIEIILFDQDEGALAFAFGRMRHLVDSRWPDMVQITFLHDSIKRLLKDPEIFNTFGQFDAIVCAGLYDYLRVPVAVNLTRNLTERLLPGGTLYIGNMVPHLPSRWIMELHLDWFLIFRTHDEMLSFARQAAPEDEVFILPEATGYNPFVCVRRGRHG